MDIELRDELNEVQEKLIQMSLEVITKKRANYIPPALFLYAENKKATFIAGEEIDELLDDFNDFKPLVRKIIEVGEKSINSKIVASMLMIQSKVLEFEVEEAMEFQKEFINSSKNKEEFIREVAEREGAQDCLMVSREYEGKEIVIQRYPMLYDKTDRTKVVIDTNPDIMNSSDIDLFSLKKHNLIGIL